MRLPKIIVQYSPVYDRMLGGTFQKKEKSKKFNEEPKKSKGFIFSVKLQKRLNKVSKKILVEMSKITGLKWHINQIVIYPVSRTIPFSHPLTIKMRKNWDYQIDNFTHEIAHNLVWDSTNQKSRITYKKLIEKYPNEVHNVILHIPIEAIVKLTLQKVFERNAKKYYKYEYKRWTKRSEMYIRAWKIMEKEGPENVLRQVMK